MHKNRNARHSNIMQTTGEKEKLRNSNKRNVNNCCDQNCKVKRTGMPRGTRITGNPRIKNKVTQKRRQQKYQVRKKNKTPDFLSCTSTLPAYVTVTKYKTEMTPHRIIFRAETISTVGTPHRNFSFLQRDDASAFFARNLKYRNRG